MLAVSRRENLLMVRGGDMRAVANQGYVRARSLAEAVAAVSDAGTVVLAGGTDIYPSHVGKPMPGRLVDVSTVAEMRGIVTTAGEVRIGGAVTWTEIARAALAPAGVAVIQAITIHEDAFARYRQNPDFIQRYIFPGGMLPTISLMQQRATAAGLTFETVERFGSSYVLTLREWRQRFEAAWPRIEALGFDDRFRRMWLYYLTYCEVGFDRGLIDVGLYRMRKPA